MEDWYGNDSYPEDIYVYDRSFLILCSSGFLDKVTSHEICLNRIERRVRGCIRCHGSVRMPCTRTRGKHLQNSLLYLIWYSGAKSLRALLTRIVTEITFDAFVSHVHAAREQVSIPTIFSNTSHKKLTRSNLHQWSFLACYYRSHRLGCISVHRCERRWLLRHPQIQAVTSQCDWIRILAGTR